MPSKKASKVSKASKKRSRKTSSGGKNPFANLDTTSIDIPLLERMQQPGGATEPFRVIIDVNLLYADGRDAARQRTRVLIEKIVGNAQGRGIDEMKSSFSGQYFFARLTGKEIKTLIEMDAADPPRCIYKVWLDFEVQAQLTQTLSTVKADAARAAFSAAGEKVCWAVIDSGIDGKHEHFQQQENLKLDDPVRHVDFTGDMVEVFENHSDTLMNKLTDEFGHGTHVAGIIAGEVTVGPVRTVTRRRDESGDVSHSVSDVETISGVAPQCKLVSLKVLNERGRGLVSNLIAAIGYIQKLNDHGRWLQIHGVNMSVGYEFDAEWFGCGQSPLCVEVDRLVRAGVVVVVAAGNTGYGIAQSADGDFKTGLDVTINDPGNAALAITVGATHREKPHLYGVSYFSSKGPTGDGRLKPDLVAPGEKIVSCAAGIKKQEIENSVGINKYADNRDYCEQSGTSMAAPHVSGAVAAFLSIRREFIGQPERIKEIFLSTATDLGRDRYFQGHGLIDLMRAIQSV
jgi:subtilisin family serine protease